MGFLEVRELTKTYKMGEVVVSALKGISFSVEAGEFVVILGPSGSGKSTLLNILGGMDMPSSGQVMLGSVLLGSMGEKALTRFRRDHVGFVFQFYNLMANLTARENVELATEICQQPFSVEQVLADVDLLERQHHFPSQLSGGEQQRVAIARAVAKNPQMLLCDEPTGALDYATGIKILRLLRKVNREYHKTVIVITHNAAIAEIGDRVIRLSSGEIGEMTVNPVPKDPEEISW